MMRLAVTHMVIRNRGNSADTRASRLTGRAEYMMRFPMLAAVSSANQMSAAEVTMWKRHTEHGGVVEKAYQGLVRQQCPHESRLTWMITISEKNFH